MRTVGPGTRKQLAGSVISRLWCGASDRWCDRVRNLRLWLLRPLRRSPTFEWSKPSRTTGATYTVAPALKISFTAFAVLACYGEDLAASGTVRAFEVALSCKADSRPRVKSADHGCRSADDHVGWSGSERQNGRRGAEYIDAGTCDDESMDDGLAGAAHAETFGQSFPDLGCGRRREGIHQLRTRRGIGAAKSDGASLSAWVLSIGTGPFSSPISGARASGGILPTGRSSENIRRDHLRQGKGFEPDECEAAGADSRGNVFAMNGSGHLSIQWQRRTHTLACPV